MEKGKEVKKKRCHVETFSRVVGFFRPVQEWNRGKGIHGEFKDRKTYDKTFGKIINPGGQDGQGDKSSRDEKHTEGAGN